MAMVDPLVDFGRQVRQARRRHGFRQTELAHFVGCNQRTISMIEQGLYLRLKWRRMVAYFLHLSPPGG